jgi:hypothetical protein
VTSSRTELMRLSSSLRALVSVVCASSVDAMPPAYRAPVGTTAYPLARVGPSRCSANRSESVTEQAIRSGDRIGLLVYTGVRPVPALGGGAALGRR